MAVRESPVYSVSQAAAGLRALIERQPEFARIAIKGEISNLTRHASGHVYFSLKDQRAQLNAVMFRSSYARNAYKDFEEGDEAVAVGSLTIYPQRSVYQIQVETLRPAGKGQLYEQFLRLKARLEAEGLFDPERKRPIPAFPRKIVVITSPTGAAIRDVLQTTSRRFPAAQVKLLPAVVQGSQAPESLRAALSLALRVEGAEVVLITRGGGSMEDLWAFNDELLAREIAAYPIPVVSAIGHEMDFTIAEFAADQRAPTPTAAAEMITPDITALRINWSGYAQALRQYALRLVSEERQFNDGLFVDLERGAFQLLAAQFAMLDEYDNNSRKEARDILLAERLKLQNRFQTTGNIALRALDKQRLNLAELQSEVEKFDFEAMKDRGYALVEQAGKLAHFHNLKNGDVFDLNMKGGKISARVEEKYEQTD